MVVKVDNKEQTYEIPSGVQILINGEEKTLYDFRVGDIVKLTVESDAITKDCRNINSRIIGFNVRCRYGN